MWNKCVVSSMTVIAILLAISVPVASKAQWSHGSYSVNNVVTNIGNYTYSAGSNSGTVDAVSQASGSPSVSTIEVVFAVTYTAPAGSGNLTITPKGHLTGYTSGTYSEASSKVDASSGSYTKGINGGGSFDETHALGSYAISPTSSTQYITARAYAQSYPGYSSWGDSVVYFE